MMLSRRRLLGSLLGLVASAALPVGALLGQIHRPRIETYRDWVREVVWERGQVVLDHRYSVRIANIDPLEALP